MIATLQGTITEYIGDTILLDVHGVGYGVLASRTVIASAPIGEQCKLYIYEHIKEDAHALFGFKYLPDKQLFEQLLRVKNVGPKVAMAIMDIGSADDVRYAIASGDVKRLQTAKGVGKRAAEQVVVELRDKMGLQVGANAEGIVTRGATDMQDEALLALVALGYSEHDATQALQAVDPQLAVEERITQALKRGKR